MRSIAYALPTLPGFAGLKTYAAWPVWRDSTTDQVKFQPLAKKEAARRWHKSPGRQPRGVRRPADKQGRHLRHPPAVDATIGPEPRPVSP